MKLHKLKSRIVRKTSRRVGRGNGSGRGTYSGRGLKGQKARSGYKRRFAFEGGQNSLMRRIPKRGGFKPVTKVHYDVVNLDVINTSYQAKEVVDHASLRSKGVIKASGSRLKVLGNGSISKEVTVKAHSFSKSAKEKIEQAGGKPIIIE